MLHGHAWVKRTLVPIVTKFLHTSTTFEVDPARAGNEIAALKNAVNLIELANHTLAAILSNVDSLPMYASSDDYRVVSTNHSHESQLRRTYAFAQQQAATKFPKHASCLPSSLFFLRLVCPALVAPVDYGLSKSRPSEAVMRSLVLLAKLLQSVGNEVPPFGKEEYMQPLNHWVQAAIPSIRRFFRLALVRAPLILHSFGSYVRVLQNIVACDNFAPMSDAKCKLYSVWNPHMDADSRLLLRFIQSNADRYHAQLLSLNAPVACNVLAQAP